MKIVFPVLSLEMGGGARFIYHLANALADKGHDIEVVMPEKGVQVWPLRTKLRRVKELTPSSIPSADFILPNFYLTVRPAWESQKGRVVRLSLGYEPLWVPDSVTAKQTYLIGAPIMSISEWHRQLIRQETGLESTVISGGVDTSTFHPYPKPSEQTGRKNIFYIMRDAVSGYTWKGGEDFLKVVTRLKDQVNFDLTVSIPENALFASPVPCRLKTSTTDQELAQLYAVADLFVYTSYFEAFGLPPLEAMACGTAVVTTDCGGVRDYVRSGENCLLVPPSDIDQLSTAIYRLLTQDTERQRLAAAGHRFAQAWTWQRTADQVEAFLISLR
ncbi:glycosyltransferase family 4 protein [Desulfosporosinus sp. BICA1-9]|uniref:glycosyltransferase family 4 protein n=1 Tax=Desulfosporosinus sp. BICA1-9 TaxID=1531958 RepID=UPI00054C4295|nr:glycosyltransferase family 4 protein [Desulfosporosinus sp. BICA1-9]KJS89861.1 MAG: glycosyltransferase [Desulfosporosinus sp. BICA1-9]HBW34984.1 glycosyltransferase family 1 protein [Desulfosporosinus sp.]